MSMGMNEETYQHIMRHVHTLDIDMEQGVILNRKTNKTDNWGYYRVRLAGKTVKLHQILAVLRWGRKCIGMTVNHINEIKTDNSYSNLELLTNEENASLNKGGRTGKPIKAIELDTGREIVFESTCSACRALGFAQTSIRRVLTGAQKHFKGYKFEFTQMVGE